jgi:hypothetical protein
VGGGGEFGEKWRYDKVGERLAERQKAKGKKQKAKRQKGKKARER